MTEPSEDDAFAEGTIARKLMRIAIPLTLGAAVRYGVELSNAYWVGKIGVLALSVVTALGTFMVMSRMFAGLLSAGTSAVVGRMMGEERASDARRTAQKVSAVALLFGVVVAVLGLLVSPYALDLLGFENDTRREAARYLHVLLLGLPFSFGLMSLEGVLVGLGKPRAAMVSATTSLVVSFIVTPVMLRVFGAGVWGAAVGEVAGDVTGYLVGLRLLAEIAGVDALSWRKRFQRLSDLVPVIRVGAPLTVDALIHGGVWFALIAFVSRYGREYVAGQGVEERLTQVLNVPTDGIAPAAATLVGFYLGKNRVADALRVVWLSLGVVFVVALAGTALLRIAPAPMVAWLCDEPSFVHVGAQILAIAAVGLVFLGARDVLEGAFGGVGNTTPPVIIGLITALARLPLAYALAVHFGLGGLGVAWAVNITLALQALVLGAWFFLRFEPAKTV